MTNQAAQQPKLDSMTAAECKQELERESSLARLRALVAVNRLLEETEERVFTGVITGNVKDGVLRSWQYPHFVPVVTQEAPRAKPATFRDMETK